MTQPKLVDAARTSSSSLPQGQAEVRTIIKLRILDQIVVNGTVVKETVKEEEFVRKGGTIPWPERTFSSLSSISSPHSQNQTSLTSGNLADVSNSDMKSSTANGHDKNLAATVPISLPNKANSHSQKTTNGPSKSSSNLRNPRAKRPRNVEPTANKKHKTVEVEVESEEVRRETASTLLSLQLDRVERSDSDEQVVSPKIREDFNKQQFLPFGLGCQVMAKWTDKNFYPGKIIQNQGENRWQIVFDDGGKRTVHESEIVGVPYLCIGQVVMVTFSEDLCLRGVVRKPFYKGAELWYEVEYNESSNKPLSIEKFKRKDVFLNNELGIAILAKQAKLTPDNVSKFADVDLNNIIPKRSRQTALTKPAEEPDDVSCDAPIAKVKSKKATIKVDVTIVDQASNRPKPNTSKPPLVVEVPTPKTINTLDGTNPPVESRTLMVSEELGPLPKEGSGIFQSIAFLLSTAENDKKKDDDNAGHAQNERNKSDVPFEVYYITKQIEQGGGRIYLDLEEAQVYIPH